MELYNHQEQTKKLFQERGLKGLCIFHDTGLGKTITTLSLMNDLGVKVALVVTPNVNVQEEWIDQNSYPINLYFSTYNSLSRVILSDEFPRMEAIVFDESHKIKNPTSDRTRLSINLIKKYPNAYRFLLSATPITICELDFIPQLKIASGGMFMRDLGFYKIRKKYFINLAPPTARWQRWKLNPKLKAEFYEEVGKYATFLSRTHFEKLLPKKTQELISYTPSVKTKELYENVLVKKKPTPEVLELLKEYDSVNESVLLGVAHKIMVNDYERGRALTGILKRFKLARCKTIVWSYFKSSVDIIERAVFDAGLHWYGGINSSTPMKDRLAIVEAFKNDSTPGVLCASLGTLSEGINLQIARVCVFFDLSYNYADIYQAEARNYRFGSKHEEVFEVFLSSGLGLDNVLRLNFEKKITTDPKVIYDMGKNYKL